ncbi:hypothetical protein [Amycolatopsis sp. NBC_01286]|uniref:hypothetical protein n=1 Tax=Amycolatopsis sp. NBC_01286 TaxID=2903560 RepID=UPI002E1202A3|nr:hypothetical protein OG570_48215 [Amycolatopsis sp. NBC_01286]
MTFLALNWAMTAPAADVYERAILVRIAARASDDGLAPVVNLEELADFAICDTATIEDRLATLVARGVITRLGAGFELNIPAEWYSAAQLEQVNEARTEMGQRALTIRERPWISKP